MTELRAGPVDFSGTVYREPAPNDPDLATARTVELMAACIHGAAGDPLIWAAAQDAVRRFRGGPVYALTGANPVGSARAIAESVFWYARHVLRFVHHSTLIRDWFGELGHLQLLVAPETLLRMRDMVGDCAIYTMLLAAMLDVYDLPWQIVTVASDPAQPGVFSHVFLRMTAGGQSVALDGSHGKYVGWEVPAAHRTRTQAWDQAGKPIDGGLDPVTAGEFHGLHGYEAMPQWGRAIGLTGIYRPVGLGQLDDGDGGDGGNGVSTETGMLPLGQTMGPPAITPVTTSTLDLSQTFGQYIPGTVLATAGQTLGPSDLSTLSSAGVSASTSGITAPSPSNAAAWAAFATAMSKFGLTTAELAMIQPGTIISPNGTIMSVPAGTSATLSPTGAISFSSLLSSSSGESMLVIGVLLLVGILLISMASGRR